MFWQGAAKTACHPKKRINWTGLIDCRMAQICNTVESASHTQRKKILTMLIKNKSLMHLFCRKPTQIFHEISQFRQYSTKILPKTELNNIRNSTCVHCSQSTIFWSLAKLSSELLRVMIPFLNSSVSYGRLEMFLFLHPDSQRDPEARKRHRSKDHLIVKAHHWSLDSFAANQIEPSSVCLWPEDAMGLKLRDQLCISGNRRIFEMLH